MAGIAVNLVKKTESYFFGCFFAATRLAFAAASLASTASISTPFKMSLKEVEPKPIV